MRARVFGEDQDQCGEGSTAEETRGVVEAQWKMSVRECGRSAGEVK